MNRVIRVARLADAFNHSVARPILSTVPECTARMRFCTGDDARTSTFITHVGCPVHAAPGQTILCVQTVN